MPRQQVITGINTLNLLVAGTKYPISGTTLWVKSATLQAPSANTAVVKLWDQNNVQIGELLPGIAATIQGDNMDHGTAAMIDLSTLKASSDTGGAGENLLINYSNGL